MTFRTWEELVAEGRRLVEAASPGSDYRWAVGDLCVEAIPPGTGRARRAAIQHSLQQFSEETGLRLSLIKDCYRTSEKWPIDERILDIPHGKHSRYASRPRRLDLMLNDEMADRVPERIRERVAKVEELLADEQVREAVIDRSRTRKRAVVAAAKVVQDEELTKARTNLRLKEQNHKAELAAAELLATLDERTIKANWDLAKMTYALIDLGSYAAHVPHHYVERTRTNLEEIQQAACRALAKLRPTTRSPQPRTVIDSHIDHQPGAEHR